MNTFEFMIDTPLQYALTGKLQAPNPQWTHDPLPLNEYELIVMTRGVLHLTYHNQSYTVSAGELLLLSPFPPPENERCGSAPSDCDFYWLHFSSSQPVASIVIEDNPSDKRYRFRTAPGRIVIPSQWSMFNPDKLVVFMKQLQDGVRSGYDAMTIDYMTTLVLCEISNQFCQQALPTTGIVRSDRQKFREIQEYINRNRLYNAQVGDIATHFRCNPKSLSRLFRSVSGMTVKQYLNQKRIDHANFQLADTHLTVQEISDQLGFTDYHNFMKFYKKITGMTPTEYRSAFSKELVYHN